MQNAGRECPCIQSPHQRCQTCLLHASWLVKSSALVLFLPCSQQKVQMDICNSLWHIKISPRTQKNLIAFWQISLHLAFVVLHHSFVQTRRKQGENKWHQRQQVWFYVERLYHNWFIYFLKEFNIIWGDRCYNPVVNNEDDNEVSPSLCCLWMSSSAWNSEQKLFAQTHEHRIIYPRRFCFNKYKIWIQNRPLLCSLARQNQKCISFQAGSSSGLFVCTNVGLLKIRE